MSTFDERELTEDQLHKRGEHFAKGLAILWDEPKKTILEQRDALANNYKIKRYALRKRDSSRKEKRAPIRTLLDTCIDESNKEPTFIPPSFTEAYNTKVSETIRKSQLQQKLLDKPIFTSAMQRYFKAISILEYEHDNGLLSDKPFDITMIKESIWTSNEKKRLFLALDRCGKHNLEEITKRVGPSKTITEVYEYIQFLDNASKAIPPSRKKIQHPFAREMSINFLLQEERMATQIQQILEVESYEKHLELCNTNTKVQKANELFELWNMSSMTRLFAGQSDLTVLCSTTFNYYQLLKKFIGDIIVDLHTQLLSSNDKTVTTSLVNHVVARKRKFNDARFNELDVLMLTGGKNQNGSQRFNTKNSRNRSISFLAKRRRLVINQEVEDRSPLMTDQVEESDDNVYVINDDSDDSEKEEADPMLENIDESDELRGRFVVENFDAEHEDIVTEHLNNNILTDEIITFEKEINIPVEEQEQDDQDEVEMKKLDLVDEQQLSEYLGFYNTQEISDAHLLHS